MADPNAPTLRAHTTPGRFLHLQEAVVCLAGPVAGYLGSTSVRGAMDGCGADVDRARGIAEQEGWTAEEADEFVYEAGVLAGLLLKQHWDAVRAVAAALLERTRLTGKDAVGVILRAGSSAMPGGWEAAQQQPHRDGEQQFAEDIVRPCPVSR